MTTQLDILNAQIADAQARITAVNAGAALQIARLQKQITDLQKQITNLPDDE